MLTKRLEVQDELIIQTLDDLVPDDHLVRELDKIDYTFIHDYVKDFYSNDVGRPSIDPIILFKILIIKYIFNLKSIRHTMKEIEVNLAYRWFIKIPLSQKLPHYSVISSNFNNRYNNQKVITKIFQKIFQNIFDLNIISTNSIDLSQLNLRTYQTIYDKTKVVLSEEVLYDSQLV